MPFFSVLIPVYNMEKYLKDCIESVIGQTFKNYEIILVDDGSTDNSSKLCDEYSQKNSIPIKVFHQENGGLLSARRKGIQESSGKYLVFLDSDDKLRSDSLELLYKNIEDTGCDMLLYNVSRREDFNESYFEKVFIPGRVYTDKKLLYELMLFTSKINELCKKCVCRAIVDVENDYSSYGLFNQSEDAFQSLAIIDRATKYIYIDENLYFYRENSNSITRKYPDRLYENVRETELARRMYCQKWFGNIDKRVYNHNINVLFNIVVRTITNTDLGLSKKIEKIKEIINDDFFKSSYLNCDWKQLSVKKKIVFFAVRNYSSIAVPILDMVAKIIV